MQGQEALTSIIEVGIGIAGFSSIVVTLSRNHLTEDIKTAFRQIWLQSGIIISFSAIPLILSTTDVQPGSIYVIASFLYGSAMVLGLIFGPAGGASGPSNIVDCQAFPAAAFLQRDLPRTGMALPVHSPRRDRDGVPELLPADPVLMESRQRQVSRFESIHNRRS